MCYKLQCYYKCIRERERERESPAFRHQYDGRWTEKKTIRRPRTVVAAQATAAASDQDVDRRATTHEPPELGPSGAVHDLFASGRTSPAFPVDTKTTVDINESNSTAGAVRVKANLQERLRDRFHFRQEMAALTLTYGESRA